MRRLEKTIEGLIEGRILDTITGSIHPMEIAKKMSAMMRDEKKRILDRTYVPNYYQVYLSTEDFEQFNDVKGAFETELIQFLTLEAEDIDLSFLSPPLVRIRGERKLNRGEMRIECLFGTGDPHVEPIIIKGALIAKEGFAKGEIFYLKKEITIIGRSEENDISIGDPKVSGVHCRIDWVGQNAVIKDLGSRNGVKVNRRAVTEIPLKDRDEIKLGFTTFKFLLL